MIDWEAFNDEPLSFDAHVSGIEDQLDRNEQSRLEDHYHTEDDDKNDYDRTTTP